MEMNIPSAELGSRWNRCREHLGRLLPQAEGLMVFSRLNIYYLAGSFASGVLWLPMTGEPILFCRRGAERARLESPLERIQPFKSYSDIPAILRELGTPLPPTIAAEMNGLSWALANSLAKHLSAYRFVSGDRALAMTRAKKSAYELAVMREAGARHARCLRELLPTRLRAGMSELDVSHVLSDVFFSEGHHGILRMENYGEEVFLGHVSIGESANYPSVFNGPVGLRGVHPATPFMGSADVRWNEGSPLTIDNGFTLGGYMTDKTQVYWLGDSKTVPAHAADAHAFCIELQQRVAERLRPGSLPTEIWQDCIEYVRQSPWNDGFMGLGENKVSFVGHGIGLAIDEYPVLADGFNAPLEEGMVLAVEPKIGIPGFGMVGVENTFAVTPSGGISMTGVEFGILSV